MAGGPRRSSLTLYYPFYSPFYFSSGKPVSHRILLRCMSQFYSQPISSNPVDQGLLPCGRSRTLASSFLCPCSLLCGGPRYSFSSLGIIKTFSVGRQLVLLFDCAWNLFNNLCALDILTILFLSSLPLGLVSFPVMGVASVLQQKFPLKYVICVGEVLVLTGTVLFPFADSRENFWHRAFPGFFVGTAGMTIVFATTKCVSFPASFKPTLDNCLALPFLLLHHQNQQASSVPFLLVLCSLGLQLAPP